MDFSTISRRVEDSGYGGFSGFRKDLDLVFDNCMRFNAASTQFYAVADKLKKKAHRLVREAEAKIAAGMSPWDDKQQRTNKHKRGGTWVRTAQGC